MMVFSAARYILRLTLTLWSCGFAAKVTPPLRQIGERIVPARARPVPF
jgi:hypothetical protein